MAGKRASRFRPAAASTLAWVSGAVDATGYTLLLKTFTAHMSGNTIAIGASLGQHDFATAARRALPILPFFAGVVAGAWIAETLASRKRSARLAPGLCAEAVLLVTLLLAASYALRHGEIGGTHWYALAGLIGLTAFAMGLQTTTLRRVAGQSISTTFITGSLANLGEELAAIALGLGEPRLRRQKRARRRRWACAAARRKQVPLFAGLWLCYLVGGISGGFGVVQFGPAAISLPIVLLLVVIAFDLLDPLAVE